MPISDPHTNRPFAQTCPHLAIRALTPVARPCQKKNAPLPDAAAFCSCMTGMSAGDREGLFAEATELFDCWDEVTERVEYANVCPVVAWGSGYKRKR